MQFFNGKTVDKLMAVYFVVSLVLLAYLGAIQGFSTRILFMIVLCIVLLIVGFIYGYYNEVEYHQWSQDQVVDK
jgi:quinol-cytochrome oxidoreductase complex cytochrome b subunit